MKYWITELCEPGNCANATWCLSCHNYERQTPCGTLFPESQQDFTDFWDESEEPYSEDYSEPE